MAKNYNQSSLPQQKEVPGVVNSPNSSLTTYSISSTNVDNFDNSSMITSGEPFDVKTGLSHESPEIIALTDFIPVYNDEGNLNDAGKILQAKQESLLMLASSAIGSIIDSQEINLNAKLNRNNIKNFCDNFGRDIEDLLKNLEDIKNSFDFRRNIDVALSYDLWGLGFIPSSKDYPEKLENILFNNSAYKSWTPTKAWIQSCLEFKEFLKKGRVDGILGEGIAPYVDTNDPDYLSPYKLKKAVSENTTRLGFNENIVIVPAINGIDDLTTNYDYLVKTLGVAFNGSSRYSLFNKKHFSDTTHLADSIARLSYILCKEFLYSTMLDSTLLSIYGYQLNSGQNNSAIWDYLIGQSGPEDITDISKNPLGNGNSLISLSQSVENNSNEILTFENRYITDDIGTNKGSTITPGTFYYLESSINTTENGSGFDTSRLYNFNIKLSNAIDMLNMVKNNLSFDKDILPFSSPAEKNNPAPGASNSYKSSMDLSNAFSDPISLIRYIEEKVLVGTDVFAKPYQRLWTSNTSNENDLGQGQAPSSDASSLLISSAMEDSVLGAELKTLLFLYVLSKVEINNSKNLSQDSQNYKNIRTKIVDSIVSNLNKRYIKNGENIYGVDNKPNAPILDASEKYSLIYISTLKDNLNSDFLTFNLLLNNLINFFSDLNNSFENLKNVKRNLFVPAPSQKNNPSQGFSNAADKRTAYLGVQKTNYLASIFELCCLMIHSVSSENFIYAKPPFNFKGKNFQNSNSQSGQGAYSSSSSDPNGDLDLSDAAVNGTPNDPSITITRIKTGVSVSGPNSNVGIEINPSVLNLGFYDDIVIQVENSLDTEKNKSLKIINKFWSHLKILQKKINDLLTSLNSGKYNDILSTAKSIIKDQDLIKSLMSPQQLRLIRSKLFDISNRAAEDYSSPIKYNLPYFLNLKDKKDFELFLPTEDLDLLSWNLLLKDFLKEPLITKINGRDSFYSLLESSAFNKKIISIGIPQNLYRRLQVNAADLKSSNLINGIFKINLYKIDTLRPCLTWQPISYIFNMNLYPTRILGSYKEHDFSKIANLGFSEMMGSAPNHLQFVPSIESNSIFSGFNLRNNFDETDLLNVYNFLKNSEKEEIFANHFYSHLMELYLKFLTDLSFDEQKYFHYETIKKSNNSEYSKFLQNVSQNLNTNISSTRAGEITFTEDSFLMNVDNYKFNLINPRKFDRVFHVLFDSDDFLIDKEKTQTNFSDLLNKYTNDGFLIQLPDGNLQRKRTVKGEITLNKYYCEIESYAEAESAS